MTPNVTPFRNINHVSMLWAAPERSAEIAALHKRLFYPAWDEAAVNSLLEHPASTSLVAVAGDPKVIVGFIIGQLAADEAEILSVGVAPAWQRAGLGKKLVEALIRAVRNGEAKRLFLEGAADNAGAIALYKSLNFKETGRRKGYYERVSGPPADALLFAIDL